MRTTPLHGAWARRHASFATYGTWRLPSVFADVEADLRAMQAHAGLVDMSDVGLVTLRGPDARRFCNGMFTNNVARLAPGQGNRNAMTDDRGRVQGFLDLYCVGDDAFLAALDGVTAAWFEERYRNYIVFDDVELEMHSDDPWVLSLQGPGASDVLRALGLPTPEGDRSHVVVATQQDGASFRVARRDRSGLGGFDLIVPTVALEATVDALTARGATAVGRDALDAARIQAGHMAWPVDGTDKSMVHELGVDREVCAFDKGCYVGQEIINRIDVKGAVTKRLTLLELGEDALPPSGAEVVFQGEVVGSVSSTARANRRPLALATVRRVAWEPGTTLVVQAGGRAVPATVVAPSAPGHDRPGA